MGLYYTSGDIENETLRCQTPNVNQNMISLFKQSFGDMKVDNLGLCGSLAIRISESGNRVILVRAIDSEMAKKAIEARYTGRYKVFFLDSKPVT